MLSDDELENNDYVIGVATLWNNTIYGVSERNNHILETSWFLYDTLTLDEFYDDFYSEEYNWLQYYTTIMTDYVLLHRHYLHSVIRNFIPIISNPHLDILKVEYLNSSHIIVTKKTIWLKVIQRVWKKKYKLRLQQRNIHGLFRRQLIGKLLQVI